MKDEIKEILDDMKIVAEHKTVGVMGQQLNFKNARILLDYITNLQEKSNNQAEEINKLYKQREKFMKKYDYLKEENEKLKELCNKYEEEHSTTFNEWKETITDKYQTLKNLQEENEELKTELQEAIDSATWWNNKFKAVERDNRNYKSRNEKDEYIIGSQQQQLDKYKNVIDKIKEYVKENSIYYNTSDGCQWVDQFKILDKIDELLEEVDE